MYVFMLKHSRFASYEPLPILTWGIVEAVLSSYCRVEGRFFANFCVQVPTDYLEVLMGLEPAVSVPELLIPPLDYPKRSHIEYIKYSTNSFFWYLLKTLSS